MTNYKNLKSVPRDLIQRGLVCSVAIGSLVGCSAFNSLADADRVDYRGAVKVQSLDVPPDLTQLQRDNRYAIPDASATSQIAPNGLGDVRIERADNQRWLVVKQTPDVLWPKLKSFWQDSGFTVNVEKPEAGVMETDWAENRAKIPQDFIRNTVGKMFDGMYSTGERDKFRTRLERGADGTTEIYISHRGAVEVLVGQSKESTSWTARPSDPGLEAEFLSRLMVRLGAAAENATKAAVVNATPQASHAALVKGASGSYIELNESFDRAWRRVGLGLDRVGFTVEDRDRVQGVYFVRYIDQANAVSEKGFFARMFSNKEDDEKAKAGQRYRVSVKAKGAGTQVLVLSGEGKAESSPAADKILAMLNDQLK